MSIYRFCANIPNHFRDFHLCELARLATPLMACALAPQLQNINTRRKTILKNRSAEQGRTASCLFTYFSVHTEDSSSRGKLGELPILGNSCFKETITENELAWWENERWFIFVKGSMSETVMYGQRGNQPHRQHLFQEPSITTCDNAGYIMVTGKNLEMLWCGGKNILHLGWTLGGPPVQPMRCECCYLILMNWDWSHKGRSLSHCKSKLSS